MNWLYNSLLSCCTKSFKRKTEGKQQQQKQQQQQQQQQWLQSDNPQQSAECKIKVKIDEIE